MAPSPPPRADPPAAAKTTIHDVPEDIMREILLSLHSSLSLACAMRVCRRWAGFHKSFRETHASSPLIGLFTNNEDRLVSRPTFHCIDERDNDMAAIIQKCDSHLGKLKSVSGARWRILDSRNGVLLLCRDDDNSLWVYNPVSVRQPVRIKDRPDDVTMDGKFVAHCLLDGTVQQCLAVDSFRVLSVQQFRREIRAVEYDSSTGEWHCHQRQDMLPGGIQPKWYQRPMYAAGHVFWKYHDEDFSMFVLDTRTMEFSARSFPKEWKDPVYYSIGEIEDGKGYLVCPRGLSPENFDPRLQVWSINADNNMNMLELDLNKQVPMSQLAIPPNMSSNVYTVINGLAIVTSHFGPHFVVDLHKETLLATFPKKLSGQGYLYQLSWPHAISSGSTPPLEDNNIDTPQDDGPRERKKRKMKYANNGLLLAYKKMKKMKRSFISITSNGCPGETTRKSGGDEPSKLSLGNEIKEPPSLSYLDNTCSQSQCVDPPDVNEGSSNEVAPCENHHTLKSPDNPTDDEPRERRNKRKTSNGCPGETTSCDPLVVESEIVSTTAVPQNNPRVPCRNILVGQQATAQGKPLNEDVLNCPQIKEPPTFSCLDNTCSQSQYIETPDVNEGSANEAAPCENLHTFKSRADTPKDDGPRKTKKRKIKVTRNARLGETTMGYQDQHIPSLSSCDPLVVESEIVSTTAVPQNNPRVPCKDSLVGQQATLQYKPLNEDVLNCPQCSDAPKKSRRKAAHTKGARRTRTSHTIHAEAAHPKGARKVGTKTEKMYKCDIQGCTSTFSEKRTVSRHVREKHGQGERIQLQCTGCNRTFKRKDHLNSHFERIHNSKETPLVCGFKGCHEVFYVKHKRRDHMKSIAHVQLDTKKIKCGFEDCADTFTQMHKRNEHYIRTHETT